MHRHSLELLEYPKVLEQLVQHCAFRGGQTRARQLQPSADLSTIQTNLDLTEEACAFLVHQPDPSFGGIKDVTGLTARAVRGIRLPPPDLYDIHLLLDRILILQRTFAKQAETYPGLAALAALLQPCRALSAEIVRCIHERGEVRSQASPALDRIRSDLRREQSRLVRLLGRLTANPALKPYLQDNLVTQRQGRYVVPIRTEYKSKLPGIVHDQSASGATTFIEPLDVVEQNNAVRSFELAERKEVDRILGLLSKAVAAAHTEIELNVSVLSDLDFVLAKARYAYAVGGIRPEMVEPQSRHMAAAQGKTAAPQTWHPGSLIWLRQARHPLLPKTDAVPLDFELGPEPGPTGGPPCHVVVITGPNTGGKTVSLKTVGLMTLMAQAGLLIPAGSGSRLSVFDNVYADIGDEQSIEQSLSTFSSHLTHIVDILDEATDGGLVILDEIGAGTDPEEGSALAAALLEHLRRRGVTTLASTHYSEIKLYAHNTVGVCNAAMEFDVETLQPTYKLHMGLPGRSNALTIARHLGLSDTVVRLAEANVKADVSQANAMLEDIRLARQRARELQDEARQTRKKAQRVQHDLAQRLAHVEEERQQILAATRADMTRMVARTKQELRELRKQAAADFKTSARVQKQRTVDTAQAHLATLATALPLVPERPDTAAQSLQAGPIARGDTVWIGPLQATGTVISEPVAGKPVEVQAGQMRLKTRLESLELRQKAAREAVQIKFTQAPRSEITMELDIRGARVEPGIVQVDRYLQEAYFSRLPWVRIIHGKGTGQLRAAVRQMMNRHPHVAQTRPGDAAEGGEGVTIATLDYD